MNCSEAKELIQLYMDSELEARVTLDVQRHLETCSACNRTLHILTDQDEKLRKAARAEAISGVGLRTAIIEAIRKEHVPAPVSTLPPARVRTFRRSGYIRVAAAAAAIVVVAVLVFVLLNSGILSNKYSKVYADAIDDHLDHCTLKDAADVKMVSDPAILQRAMMKYCRVNGPMDLSNAGFSGVRAKLCELDNKAYVHMLYFKSGETPGPATRGISFFLRADSSVSARSLDVISKNGLFVGSGSRPGIEMIVVSPFSKEETKKAADLALSELKQ